MAGVNRAIIVGRVGKDPEVRTMQNGDKVVSFSIATSDVWRSKDSGERQERTTWHNIVIFNENIGKIAEAYVKKGSQVYVDGQIAHREWTDKDGGKRNTTEIVLARFRGELALLDSKGDGERSQSKPAQRDTRSLSQQLDDDIVF